MADINKKFEIEVVLKDGEAKAKIKGVTKEFVDLGEATKVLEQNTRENTQADEQANKVREGSYDALIKQKQALLEEQAAVAKDTRTWKSYTKQIVDVDARIEKLTGGFTRQGQANKDMISNAGLAGATLTELGRTVSDSNYGIRGMANNLSQLSTLFVTLISKTGSFKSSIGVLLTQIQGPLGFILAFQAAIALLERFSINQDEAKSASKGFEEQIVNTTTAIKDQNKALQDNEDRAKKTELSVRATLLSAREFMGTIREGMEEFNEEGIEKAENALLAIFSLLEEAGVKNIDLLKDENIGLEQRIQLADALIKQSKLSADIAKDENTLFTQRIKLAQLESKLSKEKDEADRLAIQRQIRLTKSYVSGTALRLENLQKEQAATERLIDTLSEGVVLSPKDSKESQRELKKVAKVHAEIYGSTFEEELKRAKLFEKVFGIDAVKDAREALAKAGQAGVQEFLDNFGVGISTATDTDGLTPEEKAKQKREELVADYQDSISAISDALTAQYDAEISIEEAKTAKLNNELRKRLSNEKLTAKEREQLNLQIANNEEKLRQKRDEIAEKQFKVDKAVALSTAMVNTFLAATDVLAREKMGVVGKIVAMTAIIGAGLAQVAAISKQKFVPSASSVPAAASATAASAPAIQPPDFNIVGASNISQLAESIERQRNRPVEAYVVSKNISTAQELDRNKVNSASL